MDGKEYIDELIRSLRCSTTCDQMGHTRECLLCAWHGMEEIDERIPCPADIEIDGKKYWLQCDCDRLVRDAADMIERLANEKECNNNE